MKTLSTLEIGQHFTKYRRMVEYTYMGILNGEFIYMEAFTSSKESYETSEDFRVNYY